MGKAMTVAEIQELVPTLAVTVEPVGRLQEYAGNAKEHTAEQVEQIKASMRQVGFCDPIGVWTNAEGKSEVVEGHGRLMAALELGLQSVPVIHLDGLSDEQRRFYALVHNKLTMNTGWDLDKLVQEANELDYDWGEFGFDELADEGESLGELSADYSQNVGTVEYEPSDSSWRPSDLYAFDEERKRRIDELIGAVKSAQIRKMLKVRQDWMCEFDFGKIADYYAYQADENEQRAFEALGLVLLDRDQLIANGFADIAEDLVGGGAE